MNKPLAFWTACALILFLLSLVWLEQGLHRKNGLFTLWLLASVGLQLFAAWSLALDRPWWFGPAGQASGIATGLLAAAAVAMALTRWECPVNRVIVLALGGMLGLQIISQFLIDHAALRVWSRNIGFLGPAIYMLIAFSGIRFDRMPLWADEARHAVPLLRAAFGWARAMLG